MVDHIYLAEAQNGLIKIGRGTNPHARVGVIALASPVLVRLVAYWPAARGEELELHRRFDALRAHKEWFRIEAPLDDFLAEVWGRGVETIAAWDDLTFRADGSPLSRMRAERSAAARARWADPEWKARWMTRRLQNRLHQPGHSEQSA